MSKSINELNAEILNAEKRQKELASLINREKTNIESAKDDMTTETLEEKHEMIKGFEAEFLEKDSEITGLRLKVEDAREKQKSALSGLNTTVGFKVETEDQVKKLAESPELLEAWSKSVKGDSQDYKKLLATTDAGMDGIIPTYVSDTIERKIAEIGGLFNHAAHVSIKSILTMAVEKSSTGAGIHPEGTAMLAEEEITLESVVMQPEMIKKWISWTDEIEALSGVDLVNYLVDEFVEKHLLKIEQEMLTGADDSKGLVGIKTIGAIADNGYVNVIEDTEITFSTILQMLASTKGSNLKFFMNRNTFYNQVMGLTDTNERPIFTQLQDKNGTVSMTVYGIPVEIEEIMADGEIILMNQGAYKTNTPNGMTPTFVLDRISGAREDKVILTGKTFIAGRPVKLEQTTVFQLAVA